MIKEVGFERLFTFAQYENEKIRLTATVEPGEDSNKVLAGLLLKVVQVENTLAAYRDAVGNVQHAYQQKEYAQSSVSRTHSEMDRMKIQIAEITKMLETDPSKLDEDTRLRHACDRTSYKKLTEQLESQQIELQARTEALDKAKAALDTLTKKIENGDFGVPDLMVMARGQNRY